MAYLLQKARAKAAANKRSSQPNEPKVLQVVKTSYTSLPVDTPASFLEPLSDPSAIKVQQIDFANSTIPEYEGMYAVVLDNVLSQEECNQLIYMAEQSAGGHGEEEKENNGWVPAMVNAGVGQEFLALDYRNSDRIIWDNRVLVERLWKRILQGNGINEYLSKLDGEDYIPVVGDGATRKGERWVASKQGLNERMRFLKYGMGQYFRRHCDGAYGTPDGSQRSFYTVHLYLNNSAQALGLDTPEKRKEAIKKEKEEGKPSELLFGGATTFHSARDKNYLDVDPKAGRVLIFQHRRLLHSGDDVVAGIKYTMRSDLMYEFEGGSDGSPVTFG